MITCPSGIASYSKCQPERKESAEQLSTRVNQGVI